MGEHDDHAGSTRRARVIATHRAPDRPSIRVAPGDAVTLGDRDGEWPQFVWTTIVGGLGGWIPAVLFDRDRGDATAQRHYDTRELDADPGDVLVLHHELADWWWAENARGATGWVPACAIEPIASSKHGDDDLHTDGDARIDRPHDSAGHD